jgi:hypothetical protein
MDGNVNVDGFMGGKLMVEGKGVEEGVVDVEEKPVEEGEEEIGKDGYDPGNPGIDSSSSWFNDVVAGSNSSGSHVRSTAISFNDIVPLNTNTICPRL